MNEHAQDDKRLAKGQRTRQALIRAGLALFAAKGFEAVTTRELAAGAKVNIAAIHFHFQGKEGLYQAVIDHVIRSLTELYGLALAEAPAGQDPPGAASHRAARAGRAVDRLLTQLLSTPRSRSVSLLLQREIITPTPAFQRLFEQALLPILSSLAELAHGLAGHAPDSFETRTLAFALFAQLSCFSRSKTAYLAWLGKDGLDDADVERLCALMRQSVVAGLTGLKD